jgi:hypothetical protein
MELQKHFSPSAIADDPVVVQDDRKIYRTQFLQAREIDFLVLLVESPEL